MADVNVNACDSTSITYKIINVSLNYIKCNFKTYILIKCLLH